MELRYEDGGNFVLIEFRFVVSDWRLRNQGSKAKTKFVDTVVSRHTRKLSERVI